MRELEGLNGESIVLPAERRGEAEAFVAAVEAAKG